MDARIAGITKDLSEVAADAHEHFGPLSAEQLNWKTAEESWSVAQCLDHLIRTNHEFDA